MERDLAGTVISQQAFDRLAHACRRDRKFPKSFENWQKLVETGTAEVLAHGEHVEALPLEVDDFVTWCQTVQVIPCLDALRAFMILLRSKHSSDSNKNKSKARPAKRTPDDGGDDLAVGNGQGRSLLAALAPRILGATESAHHA
jgi:hypothetical protein